MSLTKNGASFRVRGAVRQVLEAQGARWPVNAIGGAIACLALGPLNSAAQEPPPAEKTLPTVKVQDEGEVEPVVTQIGRTPQLLRDIPQTITVLNSEVLDAQGATTLTDALRNVPGVTLSAGEGGNIGDNVNLRGFSARTDIYIDGMRDRGQYSRETFFLDAVEVLKGPSSMLFGRGSTGGVINQVSKQPSRQPFTTVSGSVGTDNYYRVTADTNQPLSDSIALRVAVFGHTAESTRDIVETERYGIAPSLRLGIGTPTEITLSAIIQRRDDIPDYGFPFPGGGTEANPVRPVDLPRENFLGFTDDRFEQDVNVAALRISHEFSPSLTLRNQTQFNQAEIFARPTTISVTGANPTTGLRNPRQRDVEDQSLFNQTDLIIRLNGDTLAHTITTGAEIGRDDYENQTYTTTGSPTAFTQNLFTPTYGPTPANAVVAKNSFTDNVGKTIAVYANEQLDLGAKWKFVAGLRWDQFEFDSVVTPNTGANAGIPATTAKTDDMTSVRAGVVYQPDEVQTYYVSYGTSFNPSAEGLTLSAANQNVDPEENRSFEVGAKLSYNEGQLLVTGALFRVEKDNARTTDATLGITTLDGNIRVQGAELGISGEITDAWMVIAGYTYLDGEIVETREVALVDGVPTSLAGNVYPNTPEHSASLWSTYDLSFGLQFGAGLVYVDDRLLNNANTAMTDSYTRVDATIAYLAKRYSVRVNLQNLTDAEFFEVASAGRATPVAGRAAIATFNWTF